MLKPDCVILKRAVLLYTPKDYKGTNQERPIVNTARECKERNYEELQGLRLGYKLGLDLELGLE